ncbi:head-tail connector protein [Halomonas rhizosphaerae]|uniref:Head-tail connector protein n=1 Tax=Halomonas rhizosphaerae TaxID=3043296 RepID=A0ABT6UXA4_9GAMM|nr:head-tail connector protein [Halomonas rhizosphaerae]MDI5890608.1 head-tail connector protein [Halomonas rhizosphaerae]
MLDLSIIKPHVRLELDETDEDVLLETYATAAQRLVENRTGRTLYATDGEIPTDSETGEPTDDSALVLDDDLTTAMLLLIGHWFENREAVVIGSSPAELPMAVEALISPYRHYQIY